MNGTGNKSHAEVFQCSPHFFYPQKYSCSWRHFLVLEWDEGLHYADVEHDPPNVMPMGLRYKNGMKEIQPA